MRKFYHPCLFIGFIVLLCQVVFLFSVYAQSEKENFYIVGSHGDISLWEISVLLYGNGKKWKKIAKWNDLKNPNMIYPGKKLILKTPPLYTPQEGKKKIITSFWKKHSENITPPLFSLALFRMGYQTTWPSFLKPKQLSTPTQPSAPLIPKTQTTQIAQAPSKPTSSKIQLKPFQEDIVETLNPKEEEKVSNEIESLLQPTTPSTPTPPSMPSPSSTPPAQTKRSLASLTPRPIPTPKAPPTRKVIIKRQITTVTITEPVEVASPFDPKTSSETLGLVEWYLEKLDIHKKENQKRLDAMMEKLIQRPPEEGWRTFYIIGQYFYKTKRYEKAQEFFKHALQEKDSPIQVAILFFLSANRSKKHIHPKLKSLLFKKYPALQGLVTKEDQPLE